MSPRLPDRSVTDRGAPASHRSATPSVTSHEQGRGDKGLCKLCVGTGLYQGRLCPRRCGSVALRDPDPTLFDLPSDPMVRSSDPETSRAAARSVEANYREQEVIDALRLLSVASSAFEIQQCMESYGIKRDKNCVSRRLTSLVRKGLVSDSGLKPGPYKRDVTAYRLRSAA